jgi:hypothetical protein
MRFTHVGNDVIRFQIKSFGIARGTSTLSSTQTFERLL